MQPTSFETGLAAVVLIITAIASGGALFVSMKVSNSIASFKNDLIEQLDKRYVMKSEHNQLDALRLELDDSRRTSAKDRLEGVEVELHRYRDDLDITLKNILTAVNATHPISKQRI